MSMSDHALAQTVQTNCHIADAAHAADMTLCIYLLQMREFCRWEQGIAPLQPMAREQVGAWLTAREALWDQLEGAPWRPLEIDGQAHDPFDVAAINAVLAPRGLVYGAGYIAPGRASFFLAELEQVQQRDGVAVHISGRELARGLASPPAVLGAEGVFLRRESLQRWLWEKYEAWTLRRPVGAFKAALDAHGLAEHGEQAVPLLAQAQTETLILHELGEARVAALLEPHWQALRGEIDDRRTALHLRAVRDLLADCLVTLPTLLERQADASLHFWFSNFEGLREQLFPRLGRAYEAWLAGDGGASLWDALAAGTPHWQQVCEQVLALHREHGAAAQDEIGRLLQARTSVLD